MSAIKLESSVVGIGMIAPHWHEPNTSGIESAGEALMLALDDAGLSKDQIGGLVIQHGQTAGPDYDEFAQYMDLNIEWANQTWAHGRFTGTGLILASLMVQSGAVDYVAFVSGYHRSVDVYGGMGAESWREENRAGGGPHGEQPRSGLTAPVGQAAMAARTYSLSYGVGLERLYDVVAAERAGAAKNPSAMRRRQLSLDDYLGDPMIVDPLRRADIAPVSEGGSCIVVSRTDTAASARHRSVQVVAGQGLPAGRHETMWSRPGLGVWLQQSGELTPDNSIYRVAGIPRKGVQLLYTYDAFSPLVWFSLERFGFCPAGHAASFIADTGIGLDGNLPVNTSGGMLCEGSRAGWGHLIEIVRQLRGEAGDRQVSGAEFAQWAPCFGESVMFAADV
jgi:acetyl-CoA acetyltransferase